MGGDLKITWREPQALRDGVVWKAAGWLALHGVRLAFMAGTMVAVAYLFQQWLLPDLELRWHAMVWMIAGVTGLCLLCVLGLAMSRTKYKLTDDWIYVDNSATVWLERAQFFVVRAPEDLPDARHLLFVVESPLDFSARFWRWFSSNVVEPERSQLTIPLPEDEDLAARVLAEVEERVPNFDELSEAQQKELEAHHAQWGSDIPQVFDSWLAAGAYFLGVSVLCATLGALHLSGTIPQGEYAKFWRVLAIAPIYPLGPATWMTLIRHGRAGFARAGLRAEVALGNMFACGLCYVGAPLVVLAFEAAQIWPQ